MFALNSISALSFVVSAPILQNVLLAAVPETKLPLPPSSVKAAKFDAMGRLNPKTVSVPDAVVGSTSKRPLTVTIVPTCENWQTKAVDESMLVVLVSEGV